MVEAVDESFKVRVEAEVLVVLLLVVVVVVKEVVVIVEVVVVLVVEEEVDDALFSEVCSWFHHFLYINIKNHNCFFFHRNYHTWYLYCSALQVSHPHHSRHRRRLLLTCAETRFPRSQLSFHVLKRTSHSSTSESKKNFFNYFLKIYLALKNLSISTS